MPNSVEIWQTFRDAWSSSVIFGKADVQQSMTDAATKIDGLAASNDRASHRSAQRSSAGR